MNDQIFISYRRDGGDIAAKLICEALKNRGFSVFYDYDSLRGGIFDTKILKNIDASHAVVLVLPKKALDRCKDEGDWVRQEIAHALKAKKNILPVMMDGFEFPKALPEDIRDVARFNGVRFHMDFFDAVIDRIVERIAENTLLCNFPDEEAIRTAATEQVRYKIHMYIGSGNTSELILCSTASTEEHVQQYEITEEEWKQLAEALKRVVSVLLCANADDISINRKSALGQKACAPCNGSHYEEQYRIRFDISCIADTAPGQFDSAHFTIENNGTIKLTLFRDGKYVFYSVAPNTKLSHFGIDENALIEATMPLVLLCEHHDRIRPAAHFESKVYPDHSGSYTLKYNRQE